MAPISGSETRTSRALLGARLVMTLLVLLHLWPNLRHGAAHEALGVPIPPGWTWFVYLVILLLPVLAAVALWTRFFLSALLALALAFLSSTVFGVYHHYIAVSIDNVHHLPEGPPQAQEAFVSSAAALAGLELLAAVVAAFFCGYFSSRE